MEINGKVVIVTGASAGIGLAAARLFAQRGAKVALVARSEEVIRQLAAELPGAFAYAADLGQVEQVPAVIEAIQAHYGRIDVLVNNAGRAFHTSIEQADVQLYRQMLDLNVVSVLRLMQCAIPMMRARGGGVIVNVSSGLSKRIMPGVGPYASSKYALNALTLTARAELEPAGIRVCLVIPGRTINTKFRQNAFAGLPSPLPPPELAASIPVDTPEDVAEKILEAVQTEAPETYTKSTRPA